MIHTVLSFSGGKDSSFALYKLKEKGIKVSCLITTIWKKSGETVAHGEKIEKVKRQAEALDIPLAFVTTDFEAYTEDFKMKLNEIKKMYQFDAIAFGDIYLEGHRKWGEALAEATGLKALYPLWTKEENAIDLLHDYVKAGFKSKVIKIDEEKLPKAWLNREVDEDFIADIITYDVCPLGESGEYHTYVYDGPIFKKKE